MGQKRPNLHAPYYRVLLYCMIMNYIYLQDGKTPLNLAAGRKYTQLKHEMVKQSNEKVSVYKSICIAVCVAYFEVGSENTSLNCC